MGVGDSDGELCTVVCRIDDDVVKFGMTSLAVGSDISFQTMSRHGLRCDRQTV